MNKEEAQQEFTRMSAQIGNLRQKLAELEGERYEHELVIKALEPMDDDRKCYRLIGGVLVERTKKEVYPAVQENLQYIIDLSENFIEQLKSLEQAALDFRKEHDLGTQQQQPGQGEEDGQPASSGGLLV